VPTKTICGSTGPAHPSGNVVTADGTVIGDGAITLGVSGCSLGTSSGGGGGTVARATPGAASIPTKRIEIRRTRTTQR